MSSEGLSAMLGDSGDLQTALIKQIQNGKKIKGTTDEWVTHASVRARELLNRKPIRLNLLKKAYITP